MNSRGRVIKTLQFEKPDRVPRQVSYLPGAMNNYGDFLRQLMKKYPDDFGATQYESPAKEFTKGSQYEIGTYVDEWGCVWENEQTGVQGEVKKPILDSWSKLDSFKPPFHLLGRNMESVNESCAKSSLFLFGSLCPRPFERYQFLRGTENTFYDIMDQSSQFRKLLAMIHEFYMKELEQWVSTDVDAIAFMDDWGAQNSLLIKPELWREIFKPLYTEYCQIIHKHGKFVFMHSDGYIFDIYEDLIEIGVNAINSQLFCMDICEIGRKFKGRITFWGELCRQKLLPHGTTEQVRAAVRKVYENLSSNGGGVIAQCEAGLDSRLENLEAVYDEWNKLSA